MIRPLGIGYTFKFFKKPAAQLCGGLFAPVCPEMSPAQKQTGRFGKVYNSGLVFLDGVQQVFDCGRYDFVI